MVLSVGHLYGRILALFRATSLVVDLLSAHRHDRRFALEGANDESDATVVPAAGLHRSGQFGDALESEPSQPLEVHGHAVPGPHEGSLNHPVNLLGLGLIQATFHGNDCRCSVDRIQRPHYTGGAGRLRLFAHHAQDGVHAYLTR